MRKKRKRLIAIALSILLAGSAVDFPVVLQTQAEETAVEYRIIDIEKLDEKIAVQSLPIGAVESDIYFPDTLKVTVESYLEEAETEKTTDPETETESETELLETESKKSETETEATENETEETEGQTELPETEQPIVETELPETEQPIAEIKLPETEQLVAETELSETEQLITETELPETEDQAVETKITETIETETESVNTQSVDETEMETVETEAVPVRDASGEAENITAQFLEGALSLLTPLTVQAAEETSAGNKMKRESVILENITWVLDTEQSDFDVFSSSGEKLEAVGGAVFVYTPVIPEMDGSGNRYTFAEGVTLPEIWVTVAETANDIALFSDQSMSGIWQGVDWTLNNDGVVRISGTGRIWGKSYSSKCWLLKLEEQEGVKIKTIIIESGIDSIDYGAFAGLKNLTSVTIPGSVTLIYDEAFKDCSELKSVYLGGGKKNIWRDIFSGCGKLSNVFYNGTAEDWRKNEIDGSNAGWTQYLNFHVHSRASTWSTDETHHWYECTDPNCPSKDNDSWKDSYGEHQSETCTDTSVCKFCGVQEGKITGVAHSGKKVVIQTETTHKQYWNCCNKEIVMEELHSWDSYSGRCMKCGYSCGHEDTEVKNYRAKTCTEDGYTGNTYCKVCRKLIERGTTIPAGHDLVHHDAQAATCTEIGWEEYDTCKNCDYSTYKEVAATGHTWDTDFTIDRPATCTEAGSKSIHCQKGDVVKDITEIPVIGHAYKKKETRKATCTEDGEWTYICKNDGTHTYTEPIPATGHSFGEWQLATAPTCTREGSEERTCSACQTKEARDISAINHDWNKGTVTKPATCTEEGVKTYVCKNDRNHTYTEPILATGHDLVHHNAQAATCTEIGWEEYDTCNNCDYSTYKENAATGHSFSEWQLATAPTCTEKGSEERTCSACQLVESRDVNPVGHSWESDYTVDQEASCEADGSKSIHCSKCNAVKDGETITALGHAYESSVTTEATCTDAGVRTYVCKNDNSHTYTEQIPATGHDLVHHDAQAATCTEIGWEEYDTCKNCNYSTYKENAATGHTWDTDFTIDRPATCTEAGSKSIHCQNCNEIKDTIEIPATGHTWDDGKITTEPTADQAGIKTYTCKNCSEIKTEEVPKLPATEPTTEQPTTEPATEPTTEPATTPQPEATPQTEPPATSTTTTTAPKTGDDTNVALWMFLTVLSAGTLLLLEKRKKYR